MPTSKKTSAGPRTKSRTARGSAVRAKEAAPPAARGAAAAAGAAAPVELSLTQRRTNRKHVLDALHDETGSNGGDHAAERVIAFRNDPHGEGKPHMTFVGALPLVRWYVDPSKPNASEARSLWHNLRKRLDKSIGSAPAFTGASTVVGLQTLAEQMP